MKKIMFFSVLSLTAGLFFSFITPKSAGISFHDQGSSTSEVTLLLCNGDVVYFPEYTYTWDIRGVNNDNVSTAHGTENFSGAGHSLVTNEVYAIDDNNRFNQKIPLVNGASIAKSKYVGVLTGDKGSVDNFIASAQFIINANGTVTVDKFKLTSDCQ